MPNELAELVAPPGRPAAAGLVAEGEAGVEPLDNNVWEYGDGADESLRLLYWHAEPAEAGVVVQEEIFFVHEGTFTILLGEPPERYELLPRSMVVVEPGTPLKLMNESSEDGLIFIYGAPADSAAEILEQ